MGNFFKACSAFWQVLLGKAATEAPKAAEPVIIAETEKDKEAEKETAFENGAVYALTLLQREGRLVDFLTENIDAYDNAKIGAAVRQIHAGCAKVLKERFHVAPVFDAREGGQLEVPEGFDPSEVRLTGNAPDSPPYKGVLRHKGWAVKTVDFPTRSGKINPKIICPAEVNF